MMQFMERNKFAADDVLGLAGAAPHGLDKDAVDPGGDSSQALASGTVVEHFVTRLRRSWPGPATKPALTYASGCRDPVGAGRASPPAEFLPTLEEALADKDHQALNLLARHFLALYQTSTKTIHLENAWKATQSTLATGNANRRGQEKAVKQAVELAPEDSRGAGPGLARCKASPTKPQRGMDILATIGAGVAEGLPPIRVNRTCA